MAELTDAVHAATSGMALSGCDAVYLVGSGTEYAAALGLKGAFQHLTGLTGENIFVMAPSEFAYEVPEEKMRDTKALLIVLDASGRDAVCAVAIKRAKEFDISYLAVSGGAANKAEGAKSAIRLALDDKTFGDFDPYVQMILLGIVFALTMGADKNAIDESKVDEVKKSIKAYFNGAAKVAETDDNAVVDAVALLGGLSAYETMGTGGDYAAAWLTRAAFYRELGAVTTVEESEDWLHVNMLQLTPEAFGHIAFVASKNEACDRTLRTLRFVVGLGRKTVVVTDLDAGDVPKPAVVLPAAAAPLPFLAPMLSVAPALDVLERMCMQKSS